MSWKEIFNRFWKFFNKNHSEKKLSKKQQQRLGCNEDGERCTLIELNYQDLPKGYGIIGDDLPYVKRPLEQVKFHVWHFVIGNENFIQHLIKDEGISEEKARRMVNEQILHAFPILTEDEERERYGGLTFNEMWEKRGQEMSRKK